MFQDEGYVLKNIPKSINDLSSAYLSESDDFLNWFNEQYTKTNDNNNFVTMATVYDDFRMSDLYSNFTKREKRAMNKKKLTDTVAKNPNLKLLFKERVKIDGNSLYSVILSYKKENYYLSDDE